MRGEHLLQKQICPSCGYPAVQGHITFCNGDVVLCDLCSPEEPTPITKDYHSIYQHYAKHHGGQKGKLLEGCKQGLRNGSSKKQSGGGSHRRAPAVRGNNGGGISPEKLVPIMLLLQLNGNNVRYHFVKPFSMWERLTVQKQDWQTKSDDSLALACAVASFKLMYL